MKIFFITLLFFTDVAFAENNFPVLTYYPNKVEKKLTDFKKAKVLVFLNKSCPCTQVNIPHLEELKSEFPELEFIGIHSIKTSSPKDISDIFSLYHPTFIIGDDRALAMANTFKANRTPQVILLDEQNNILYNGGITDRTDPKKANKFYLKKALTQFTNKEPIIEKETRSLGCIIVR